MGYVNLREKRIGEMRLNRQGYQMLIVGYENNKKVRVFFPEYDIERPTTYLKFRRGLPLLKKQDIMPDAMPMSEPESVMLPVADEAPGSTSKPRASIWKFAAIGIGLYLAVISFIAILAYFCK